MNHPSYQLLYLASKKLLVQRPVFNLSRRELRVLIRLIVLKNFTLAQFRLNLIPARPSGSASFKIRLHLAFKQRGSSLCTNNSKMVVTGGLEPPTSPLSGARSTKLSYITINKLVGMVGLEPTTP